MRALVASVACAVALLVPAAVSADSFTPVQMTVTVTPVARADRPLPVTVSVSADPSALDSRTGPIRARVKLTAGECGGTFEATSGAVLLDRPLRPQPDVGETYRGSVSGAGRPHASGVQTLCVYIQDDYQQFAVDTTDYQVNVSRSCTLAAERLDRSRGRGRRRAGERALARRARAACGPGVAL